MGISFRVGMSQRSDEDRLQEDSEDLYAVILRSHEGATEAMVHAIAASGVNLSKLKLLHILARPHRVAPTIHEAGLLIQQSTTQATRLASQLDEAGLVHRIDDENDKRVKRVKITQKGRELLEELDRARIRQLKRFLRSLSADERRALRRALDELVKRPDVAALRPVE